MATVKKLKKAQEGVELNSPELRKGQYKRIGRIAERNPERAERVAARMNKRASRVDRGREIASGSTKPTMKNGGSLSGLKASNKRVGPVDPKGAYTKVQKKALAGAKGKATLKKDKPLGATKMKNGGKSKK